MSRLSKPDSAATSRITFAALMLGQASQGLAFTAFTPALSAMALDFNGAGHGMIIAQQILSIASAGVVLGSFLSGRIVERFGARNTVLACLAAFGLLGAGGAFFHAVWMQLAARVAVGFLIACMVTACLSTIAVLYEGNARASALGASAALGSTTALVGLIGGGILTQAFGWRVAFLLFPAFAIPGLILSFAGLPGIQAKPETSTIEIMETGGKIWPLYLLAVLISAVMFMGSTQLAFLLPQDGVVSATAIGLTMSTVTAVSSVVSFSFGIIVRRLGMQGALIAGLVSVTLSLALIGSIASPLAAVGGAALLGIYVGIVMPYIFHAVTVKAPAHARSQAIGMVNAFTFIGALINPYIFAPVSAAFGLHGLFIIMSLVMAVLACGAAIRRTPVAA